MRVLALEPFALVGVQQDRVRSGEAATNRRVDAVEPAGLAAV
jgi:hypothetical protein